MGLPKPLWQDVSDCGRGGLNLITDVPGVSVGHFTLWTESVKTGVTVVMPCDGNAFRSKLPAAAHVINGFGKSAGLIQIDELGTLETPIALTNTLSVPAATQGLISYMLERNPDIGDTTGTVNAVALECNDGAVSDIRALAVEPEHVRLAAGAAGAVFGEGCVGAGAGMICYDMKGGIGSASRIIHAGGETFTLGCLALSNFGSLPDLTIGGLAVGRAIARCAGVRDSSAAPCDLPADAERGSVIVVTATDAPLSDRQLRRICRRASVGIARTGAFIGNGSGEIALAFSTANRVPHYAEGDFLNLRQLRDDLLDPLFRATASAVEESVLSSLFHAHSITDRKGRTVACLADAARLAYAETKSGELSDMMEYMGIDPL
ncbi:MAG: P1 family peptidase [Synergistaceae bacterium]|jgi:D-aminopeptidase|nr:P1 family peptidase [Synergistaceae bacterium]